ncbi:DUF2188 domain-containing protein [Megasphaera vaginalis (ex Srinivasan et al. 2021)]|uniref:Uncharacterized protein n=1 Tax=Megasphaera vaginalis (ex Srinivasan et al. 2021) TaxID=1111454 RepID=U7UPF6_9FIRM|nr:DUF2188 domain-containing protein [Megasphaera vaginalis (ex Srinivasan et al. 2021)]ERT60784.1 hypothetical protein HMPREF1250_0272 [Megasphaera vaginalis (ex Srinivasan et al. 2021)]
MNNNSKWTYNSTIEGNWYGEVYDTREEAIAAGRKEAIEDGIAKFYIGQVREHTPKIHLDSVIDDLQDDAYDKLGEWGEGFLVRVTNEEKQELDIALNKVLNDWLDKNKLRDYGFKIVNIEEISV